MYEVTCMECGKKYFSDINRNGYCEVCRSKRIAETKHNYYEARKVRRAEVKNTLVRCADCGKLFNAVNAYQKRCEKCQLLREQNYKMTASNQYRKEHTDVIQFKVPKGERDELKKYAASQNMTLTSLILRSVEFYKDINELPEEEIRQIHEMISKNKRGKHE